MKKGVFCIILIFLAPYMVFSYGGSTSVFDIGISVKAHAMGGAYITEEDDSSSVFYNPSLLYSLDRIEVQGAYMPLYFETLYNYISVGVPTMNFGGFGFSFAALTTDNIQFRDIKGVATGETSQLMFEGVAGWGMGFFENLVNIGMNLKLDYQSIMDYTDFSFGIDLGASYDLLNEKGNKVKTALVIRNVVEPQLKLGTTTDAIPRQIIAGADYTRTFTENIDLCVRGEATVPIGVDFAYGVGLEMNFFELISLRAGYNSEQMVSGGVGLKLINMLEVDYAMVLNELELHHRFSLAVRLGESVIEMRKNRAEIETKEIEKKAREMAGKELQKLRQSMSQSRKEATKKEYFKAFHYIKGLEAYHDGDLPAALVEFQTVLGVDKGYVNTRYYISFIQGILKRSNKDMYNEEILALYRTGVEKYLSEDYQGAKNEWEKILKIDPYNKLAIENLKEVKDLLRDIERIEE